MYAYELDGYLQGYRFSNESDTFFDSETQTFKDLAGFSSLGNDFNFYVGTPTFKKVGGQSRIGWHLDNTAQGYCVNPIPWQGTMVVVMNVEVDTGQTTMAFPYLDGEAALATTNALLLLQHFSGRRRIAAWSMGNGVTTPTHETRNNEIVVYAFAFDQKELCGYSTTDGVTVDKGKVFDDPSDINTGNKNGWSKGTRLRIGNMSGILDDSSIVTNGVKCTLLEHHAFAGNALLNQPEKMQKFLTNLKDYYGV